MSAPRRSAENVAAALARCTSICGTTAAARSCGVAAVIATMCAAVVTMRLVLPDTAALVRAWNLRKAVEAWVVKPTENCVGAWVVKPGKRQAKNPRKASPLTSLITAPRSPAALLPKRTSHCTCWCERGTLHAQTVQHLPCGLGPSDLWLVSAPSLIVRAATKRRKFRRSTGAVHSKSR